MLPLRRVPLPIRREQPRLLTVAMLAHEVGIAPSTVRWLAAKKIITPILVEERTREPMRLFNPDDVQRVLAYYKKVGGIRAKK